LMLGRATIALPPTLVASSLLRSALRHPSLWAIAARRETTAAPYAHEPHSDADAFDSPTEHATRRRQC
jgi:hypothetical protein